MIDFQPEGNKIDFQLDFQEEEQPKTSWKEDLAIGLANVKNTADRAISLGAGALARPFNVEDSDKIFSEMDARTKQRMQKANPQNKHQDFTGKVIGTVGTLPLQMLAMPLSPADTGMTMIEQGETLGKARAGTAIDTLGNMVGVALPGTAGLTKTAKIASGAAINAAQDSATRKAIELIADKKTTKELLGPTLETTMLSGIVGGGLGGAHAVLSKKKTKPSSTPPVDYDAIIKADKSATPTAEPSAMQAIVDQQLSGWNEPLRAANKTGIDFIVDQLDSAKYAKADEIIAARQAALEQEVKQRATLDFNAAERQRQEQAPTGFNEWQDALRNSAETRQPGDNAPMDLGPARLRSASQYPDVNDFPSLLQDAPYQHENGIDYTQPRDEAAQAVENAPFVPHPSNNVDPFARYSPNQTARRILIEGEHPSIIKVGNRYGQGGAIDIEGVSEGIKALFRKAQAADPIAVARQIEDTPEQPRTAGKVMQRIERANKERAVGLTDQYQRVTTLEQATAMIDPSTDMSKVGANQLRSGSEGALRTNIKNGPLNFLRTSFQEARNFAETMSKQYITGKQTGILPLLSKLSEDSKSKVADVLLALDRNQAAASDELLAKFGLSPEETKVVQRIRDALDARYAEANRIAGELGYEAFKYREGYFPSMFEGAYTKLVGYTDRKTGKWVTKGVAQADTKYGLDAALKKYAEMGYTETIDVPYKGAKDRVGYNRVYNGFAAVVARMAELDGDFAKAKMIADQATSDQTRALYRFDVHELKKSGIQGNLGNRPWLDRKQNTDQLFKALVNYLEEGYRYDSLQKPIVETGKLLADPKMQEQMPNTAKFMQQYVDNLTGNNLNHLGGLVNNTMNNMFKLFGLGPSIPRKAVNSAQSISTSLMMGFGNLGFMLMQLSQPITGGLPEAARLRAATGLSSVDTAHSLATAPAWTAIMSVGFKNKAPLHLQEAFEWAHQKGMFDFSEADLVHDLEMSPAQRVAKSVANASITYSERFTRPPVFMAFADMFHKAGYIGEEALLRAQAATDYAMANYHGDERPTIYNAMGDLGKMLGALSTYKHNFVEQVVSTAANAKREPAAGVVMLGLVAGLYGISGLPGYQEMDKIVKALTDKSIREFFLDNPEKANAIMDGLASWYSGVDIQSRVSTSQLLPDANNPMSIAPHVANTIGILSAAVEAGIQQDEASLRQLLYKGLPTSARNMYEARYLTDPTGIVRDTKGNIKTETPRTQEESDIRSGLGLRPLRERLESETLWTRKHRLQKNEDKLKEVSMRFDDAVRLNDQVGLKSHLDEYVKLGGDPTVLLNRIENIKTLQNKTPKQRMEGVPNNSLQSIRRYQGINP